MSAVTELDFFVDFVHVDETDRSHVYRVPITSLLSPDEPAVSRFRENDRDYYRYGDYMYLFPIDDVRWPEDT